MQFFLRSRRFEGRRWGHSDTAWNSKASKTKNIFVIYLFYFRFYFFWLLILLHTACPDVSTLSGARADNRATPGRDDLRNICRTAINNRGTLGALFQQRPRSSSSMLNCEPCEQIHGQRSSAVRQNPGRVASLHSTMHNAAMKHIT